MFAELLSGLTPEQRHDLLVRWSRKVEIPASPIGCWTWTGSADTHGYGHLSVGGHLLQAHRVGWALFRESPADDAFVLHRCNRGHEGCVNPSHLYLGTQQDNVRDIVAAQHQGSAKVRAEQIPAIRDDQRSYRAIAEEYGISRSAVYLIKKRKNWAHIPDASIAEARHG